MTARFPARKVVAFVILVVLSLFVLVVLTALDPFGGNVALTAVLEAGVIALLAYVLTFVAVPRRRRQRSEVVSEPEPAPRRRPRV
jgi:CBS-domain-containing membrane protein